MEHKESYYQSDFYPIFHAIRQCIDALDGSHIVDLVGFTRCKAFADAFVQLVMATWEACPPDNPFDKYIPKDESH